MTGRSAGKRHINQLFVTRCTEWNKRTRLHFANRILVSKETSRCLLRPPLPHGFPPSNFVGPICCDSSFVAESVHTTMQKPRLSFRASRHDCRSFTAMCVGTEHQQELHWKPQRAFFADWLRATGVDSASACGYVAGGRNT